MLARAAHLERLQVARQNKERSRAKDEQRAACRPRSPIAAYERARRSESRQQASENVGMQHSSAGGKESAAACVEARSKAPERRVDLGMRARTRRISACAIIVLRTYLSRDRCFRLG